MSESFVNNNKRIAKNTGFLYFRMLFLMGIGFFTTRKILEALGVENLGIYDVVGSLILMFDFVSSGLSNATQRFLNIGLGQNDIDKTRQYFSQSLIVHIALVLIIALIAETVGIWFVEHKLIIPAERMDAAIMIMHFSVLSLIFRFIKICYESDIIARERMSIYAYLSIFEGIAKLVICYAVIYCTSMDKLILYGLLLLLVNLAVTLYNVAYSTYKFPETRFRFYTDKTVFKQLLSFIGINSFGVISWALGKQGINVVINMFFGPAVNGARGLAANLDRVITQFASNTDLAVRPQITKLYAQGKLQEMIILAHKSSRYIFFLAFVISLPFLFQTEKLLSIWLKEVPPYTILFVQILIFEVLGNILGTAYNNLSMAIGKIKNIQVYGRLITLSGLPLSYLALRFYPNPYLPCFIMVALTFSYTGFIIFDVNRHLHFGIKNYFRIVAWPILRTIFIVLVGAFIITKINIGSEIFTFLLVSTLLCIYAFIVIFYIGVDFTDRHKVVEFLKKRFKHKNVDI